MKIVYLFSNFHLARLTAQPKIGLELAQKARQKGEKIFVISNGLKTKAFKKNNIDFLIFSGPADLKTYFFNLFLIIKYLKKVKPDIIHVHGSLLIVYIWFVNCFLRIPLVCSLCETLDIMSAFQQKLLVFCLKQSKKVFVSCEYIKSQLIKKGLNADKIETARIGLDNNFLAKKNDFSFDADILYFGDSSEERGFDIICRLAKKLPRFRFKILLRWKQKNCLNQLKKMKNLKNVVVLNHPYKQSLKKMILKSKLVILPYRWMGVRPPLSLIESMALGKCVITSKMKGNEEIVKNEVNGFMFNFNQLKYVIAEIKKLIADNQAREAMGQKAKETIKQMYSSQEYNKILK